MSREITGRAFVATKVLLGFAVVSAFAPASDALDYVWTGDANTNDWDDIDNFPTVVSNWQAGAITNQFPSIGDTATLNSSLTGTIVVNLENPRLINSLTLTGSSPITINEAQLALLDSSITALGPSSNYTINSDLNFASTGSWDVAGGTTRLQANGLVSSSGLIKSGTGTLVLAGGTSFSAPATINAGTLQIGAGGTTGSLAVDVVNNGTIAFSRSDNVPYGGTISGTGTFRKEGAGTLTLTDDQTYTGITTITNGALELGYGATTGIVSGSILNNSSLIFNRSDNVVFSHMISGSGSITKLGAGGLTFTGDVTNGTIFLNQGTLQVGSGTSGTLAGNIVNNAELAFGRTDDSSYSGNISGTGTVTKNGNGTLTLTGNSSNTGVNTINAGTLKIGDGGTTGSLAGGFVNNANLAFSRSDFLSVSSPISGAGTLTKLGGGALRLDGPNTFTGDTHLVDGTLEFTTEANLGSAASSILAQGGALRYLGGGATASSRAIDLASDLSFDIDQPSGHYTITGAITGTGGLFKSGPGTLTIGGSDDDGLDKTVQGGVLELAGSGTLGGDITNNATVRFSRGGDHTFGGVISGTGSVEQDSADTLTLSGINSYAGSTHIEQGRLKISDDVNTGVGGGVTMQAGTTLQVTGTTTTAKNFDLPGATATIEVDPGASYTIDGDINAPSVAFHKTGGGTLILNGANNNTGGTVVAAGVLVLDNALSTGTGPIDILSGQVLVNDDAILGVAGITAPTDISIASGAIFATIGGSETTIGQLASIDLNGGAINTDRVKLQFGAEIDGHGAVNARILAGTGSTLAAAGDLSVGDASAINGFYGNGDVTIAGGATLTIEDANDAVLDSGAFVALGDTTDATLEAANGITLDFGGNIAGRGTISTPDDSAKPFTNNGNINGDSLANPLTLTGHVKGVGTLNNVVITGTDAPGFSAAAVNRGSVIYDGTLEIEFGGSSPGSNGGHDQINHVLGDGEAQLGGHLELSLINGFAPSPYETFTVITADTITGTFDTIGGARYASGRVLAVRYSATEVTVTEANRADLDLDGDVDGVDISTFFSNFTGPGGSASNIWADLDGDGDVDGVDISGAFSSFTGPLAPSNVPEPGSLAVLTLGMLYAARRRRC